MAFDAAVQNEEILYHPITGEELGRVPVATVAPTTEKPAAGAAASAEKSTVPALFANFDAAAAGKIYYDAKTLDMKGADILYATKSAADLTINDIDIDATIKGSSVETNLSAIAAGLKGTDAESSIQTFKDTILSHPDLAKSAEGMLKNEGEHVIEGMQQLLTGEGAVNMDDFKKAMEDPTKRQMVAAMFDQVATDEFGMDYAVDFTRDALGALKDPVKNGSKFLATAQKAGIDTSDLQQASMLDMAKGFMSNPSGAIASFMDSLNLSPDMKAAFTSLANVVVGFVKEIGTYYAYGDEQGPGLIEIGKKGFEDAAIDGHKIAKEQGMQFSAPAV